MPTGWRPADVEDKYPVDKIEDVYHFEKYDTNETKSLVIWSYFQLVALLLFISYLFGNIAQIGNPNMFVYGLFIFAFVYAHTELMDRSGEALISEVVKVAIGVAVLYFQKDWFGINGYYSNASVFIILYFIVSLAATFYFHYIERPSLSTSSPSMS
jgi:cation transport ATPase